ncbi:hypothetical protein ACHHYP_07162 [Achlya hypogyna]|uniref:Uncharacterized protein n=1 Tax=Achlya hypogyna TaxID=1202772 RepID=A0A1V9ZMI5_ACHHY|nr:hypothetical protein ACHHYP_07162 [Achlya hypogyna]
MLYGTFGSDSGGALQRPASSAFTVVFTVALLWAAGFIELHTWQPSDLHMLRQVPDTTTLSIFASSEAQKLFQDYGWDSTMSTYFQLKSEAELDRATLTTPVGHELLLAPVYTPVCSQSLDMTATVLYLEDSTFPEAQPSESTIAIAPLAKDEADNCAILTQAYARGFKGVLFHTTSPSSLTPICSALAASLDLTPGYPSVKGAPLLSVSAARSRLSLPAYVGLIDSTALAEARSDASGSTIHLHRTCRNELVPAQCVLGQRAVSSQAAVHLGAYSDVASHRTIVAEILANLNRDNKNSAVNVVVCANEAAAAEWLQDPGNLQRKVVYLGRAATDPSLADVPAVASREVVQAIVQELILARNLPSDHIHDHA